MSASKEILTMMHAVAEGRVQPDEATQSVAQFVVEMVAAAESKLAKQNDQYEKALREILEVYADRQAFVMGGMRSLGRAENIARAALTKGSAK